jgi:xylan 1,4-beta-xylosidase
MGDQLLPVEGEHDTVTVWGARKEYAFTFLIVNQAMPEQSIHTEQLMLTLTNTTKPLSVFVERIDADHANPRKAWMEMGEPEYPSAYELDTLKAASVLVKEPLSWMYDQGTIRLELSMPPQSVAAVILELGVEGMQNIFSQTEEEQSE